MIFVVVNGVVPDIAVGYSLQHLEFTQYQLQALYQVESRFFKPPRQTKITSKNRIVREIGDKLQRLTVE